MNLFVFLLAIASLSGNSAEVAKCHKIDRVSHYCSIAKNEIFYSRKSNILCIDADFEAGSVLLNKIKSAGLKKSVVVVVNSYGGDVNSALDVYEYLSSRNYAVAVNRSCISSCAQFIFLGAKKRYIIDDGKVIMHGVPFSNNEIAQLEVSADMRRSVQKVNARFRRFNIKHKINNEIVEGGGASTGKFVIMSGNKMWIPSKQDYVRNNISVDYCRSR